MSFIIWTSSRISEWCSLQFEFLDKIFALFTRCLSCAFEVLWSILRSFCCLWKRISWTDLETADILWKCLSFIVFVSSCVVFSFFTHGLHVSKLKALWFLFPTLDLLECFFNLTVVPLNPLEFHAHVCLVILSWDRNALDRSLYPPFTVSLEKNNTTLAHALEAHASKIDKLSYS